MRARVGARWVPFTLWAFVLVEFAGTGLTEWASLVSGLLYLASFSGLALAVSKSPLNLWGTGVSARRPDMMTLPSQ